MEDVILSSRSKVEDPQYFKVTKKQSNQIAFLFIVMLNLFQHLLRSNAFSFYQPLFRVCFLISLKLL
jgi:hypothetical protein